MEALTGEHAPTDAVVVIESDGTIVTFDVMAERLFGYTAAEAVGRNVTTLMPEPYREPHSTQLARYVTTREARVIGREVQVEALRKDGVRVPVVLRVSEIPRPGEKPLFVASICDVGARRLLRDAQGYRDVFDSALVGIALLDLAGSFVWANLRAAQILGYSVEELVARRFEDVAHPSHLARHVARVRQMLAGEIPFYEAEKRFLKKDASVVWVHLWSRLLRDDAGAPRYVLAIFDDIDARKRAEEADRITLSLLRATLDATTDGILVVDLEGRITSYNKNFAEMWHLPDSVLDAKDDEVAVEHVVGQVVDPEAFIARVRELYARPATEGFDIIELSDGRTFERYSKPQFLGDEIVGRVWSFRDTTPRRQAEERLRRSQEQLAHSQKMDAMGRLAGGVAHDFNNLLSVITGYANLLELTLAEDDSRHAWVRPIVAAVDRAAALTTQLLAFSRKQPRELAVLDLNVVVHGVEEMLARLLGEKVVLETHLDPSLWSVFADRGQLEQVIVNLAVNARDAMHDGGVLRISTSNVRGEGSPDAVRLEVADTGVGMDEATLSQIFEPFFTTKALGQGTGLGLSTVHGIVEQGGGTITVASELGKGTTFTVRWPRSRGAHTPGQTVRPPRERAERGQETVLVVEDHAELRGLVRVILESLGYRVIVAVSQHEALEAARREDVDLLLTDVVLPRASGPEIFEALRAEHTELQVLYVSGYLELRGKAVIDPNAPFLAKPFTPDALARKVREVLDGG